jgi:hypothetical protein
MNGANRELDTGTGRENDDDDDHAWSSAFHVEKLRRDDDQGKTPFDGSWRPLPFFGAETRWRGGRSFILDDKRARMTVEHSIGLLHPIDGTRPSVWCLSIDVDLPLCFHL